MFREQSREGHDSLILEISTEFAKESGRSLEEATNYFMSGLPLLIDKLELDVTQSAISSSADYSKNYITMMWNKVSVEKTDTLNLCFSDEIRLSRHSSFVLLAQEATISGKNRLKLNDDLINMSERLEDCGKKMLLQNMVIERAHTADLTQHFIVMKWDGEVQGANDILFEEVKSFTLDEFHKSGERMQSALNDGVDPLELFAKAPLTKFISFHPQIN